MLPPLLSTILLARVSEFLGRRRRCCCMLPDPFVGAHVTDTKAKVRQTLNVAYQVVVSPMGTVVHRFSLKSWRLSPFCPFGLSVQFLLLIRVQD
jgi:hypothetical protein